LLAALTAPLAASTTLSVLLIFFDNLSTFENIPITGNAPAIFKAFSPTESPLSKEFLTSLQPLSPVGSAMLETLSIGLVPPLVNLSGIL
jgi:hypothetical protein